LLLSAILSARSIIVIKFKDTLWEKQRLPCVSIFAVRILSGAWQRGFPSKKQFVVRFYVGARQTNIAVRFFLDARQTFFPHCTFAPRLPR
jgi:hypothetical protein